MNRAIPAVLLSLAMFGARAETFVPVLMYHRVADAPVSEYSITAERLLQHVTVLAEAGYTAYTLSSIAQRLYDKQPLPERAVVLTFDDGWREHATIVPGILRSAGFVASFYVMGCHWESPSQQYMTPDAVRSLASAGHEVGGHSCTHTPEFAGLSKLREADWTTVVGEALISERELAVYAGVKITSYAFPYGLTSARASQQLARYGLKFLAETGSESRVTTDTPYASVPRINVDGRTTPEQLLQAVQTGTAKVF